MPGVASMAAAHKPDATFLMIDGVIIWYLPCFLER